MQSLTLNLDDRILEDARARAQAEHTTLDEVITRWLDEYVAGLHRLDRAIDTLERLRTQIDTSDAGGPASTREERNAR